MATTVTCSWGKAAVSMDFTACTGSPLAITSMTPGNIHRKRKPENVLAVQFPPTTCNHPAT